MSAGGHLSAVVEALRRHPRLGPQLAHVSRLPAEPPVWDELDPPLPPALAAALAARGVARLWRHQVAGLSALRRGANVLLTTPTASGKSLVFQLPLLEAAARGEAGSALWLYPLKALAQDQRQKLDELAAAAAIAAPCAIYDGDTPAVARARLRERPPRVLITNPDMLHLGILPSWSHWQPFLADLRWVVLDELHVYRGIFGSHVHHVLQRLLRLARLHGAEPRLIAASATAANADEFAAALTGQRFHRVAGSGAPREGRWMLVLQPTASPYTAALQLLVELLRQGLRTIVFTKARRITELLYRWLRQQEPELARRVASYRSGFLAAERRRLEQRLFAGTLQGVIATSALEMGIDVGGLDACILVGFPGSMMATWQRSGRVGRHGQDSLTALVPLPDALDQWLVRHPGELLARPCEPLLVDPGNELVARQHLPCAAAEEPLDREVDAAYLAAHSQAVEELIAAHALREEAGGRQLHARRRRPQRGVGLRGGGDTFVIEERTARVGRSIGTIDAVRVRHECHPGAVYLHAGRQYLVRELDLATDRVVVEPVDLDWYTSALAEKDTHIIELLAARSGEAILDYRRPLAAQPPLPEAPAPLEAWLGRLRVTERVVGYERKRVLGQEVLSQHALELPPVSFETVGLWWAAPPALTDVLSGSGRHLLGSLHAAEHASIALLPLLAVCDRNDIGGISLPLHPQVGCGAVFVYDGHAGGVGIAGRGFAALPELLRRVAELLRDCPCELGCPSCVQSPKCGNGNRPLDKAGALQLARLLLGEEPLAVAPRRWELRLEGGDGGPREGAQRALPFAAGPPRPAGEAVSPATVATGRSGRSRTAGRVDRFRAVAAQGAAGVEGAAGAAVGGGAGQDAAVGSAEDPVEGSVSAGGAPRRRRPPRQATRAAALTPLAPADEAHAMRPRRWLSRTLAVLLRRLHGWVRARDPFASPPVVGSGTLVFDLETLRSAADVGGWHNAHRMGLALAVVCHLEEDRFEVFRETEARALGHSLREAKLVVGFNLRRFDYRVLAGYTGADYNRLVPTLDLLEDVHRALGFRLRLDHLARETLGSGKSADGLACLEWVRSGRLDLVEGYCRRDVEVLRDLYLFGRREGYVLYRDRAERRMRLPVRW